MDTIRKVIDCLAETHGQKTFLICPDTGRSLSYRGLQEQAGHVSKWLRHLGLERGDKVAFLMDNGLFTVELFLGAMYGGFVSVPLNVRAGVSSLSYTLEHCDAMVVFVENQYAALLKEALANVRRAIQAITVDVDGVNLVDKAPLTAEPPPPGPEDMALLMYSSGSTGQPKAAMHSHRTVLAHGCNSISSHQLTFEDRSLLVLPLYHINAECVTLIPTLMSGGSVVVPHHFSVSRFWDWLDEHQCTWSAVVPTIISQLLDWTDPRAASREAAFKRIRFLRSSSAPLSPSLHREFLAKFKLLLIQAMGSTEGGNIFSNPLPPGENKIGSPGLPWGFETKIINREGVEVPQGEPGEVLIRGAALMRGYYKDPEGTAAVLDPDGWFHTGDLAYRDLDGYFFVVGRSKDLIIKGGMNIAPKQIDEVLESHPSVLEAAAVGVPDRYVGEDIIGFVVLRSGTRGDELELLAFCENRLGHFKTPTRIHFVKDLPKGPSGKVQRLKLREKVKPAFASGSGSFEFDTTLRANGQAAQATMLATPTPIEQTIAGTWAELLGRPQVDMQDNFFSLGGHSLLAIQCLSRLREKLPLVLSLSDFFENATVAQQAALIRKRMRPSDYSSSVEATVAWEQALLLQPGMPTAAEVIPLRDRSQPCPLSPAQKRVWFFGQFIPDVPLYNESEAVRLRGKLNREALERALNVIIERHEILRTTIRVTDEEPAAVALESRALRLKQINLSALAPASRWAEVERLLIEEPRRPYNLQAEPGIRATLLQLGPEEHVFILMMHHLVCDWSSEGVIWRELSACYRAMTSDKTPILPPLPIQHGDYAAWQVKQVTAGGFADDLDYWAVNLRGAPPLLELPTDRVRPSVNSYAGARQRFRTGSKLVQALRDCSRRQKISLFTIFTAALDALLYRYTGQEDILLGIPLADRDRPELQSVIGFLLHTHVLRTQLSGELRFSELLGRVQKGVLDLYAHRAAPFDQVVSKLQPERNLSYSPLFQVMINWRDREQQLSFIGMEGLEVESLLAESRTSKFDLTFMLTEDEGEIWLEIEYATDLFDVARIERMAGHYRMLLEGVAANPEQRLSELPVLTPPERRQVLVEWNRTEVEYPKGRCLHEQIEAQVGRTPEAVAVVFEDQQLTYRQLNERGNRLAHHLQKLGVGPDALVGVCVERSLEMVVGLLGILKAGGAYVPMDPEYPRERLAFMLEDAQPTVVLTQQRWVESLPAHQAQVVRLDADWPAMADAANTPVRSRVTADNLAYVIYTSGSTGKPKGVAIEHRSAVSLATWARQIFTDEEFAGVLFSTSISFDVSIFELFVTLENGGKVILAKNALELPTLLAANQVRMINTVPSAMAELVRMNAIPRSVITVNLAGEPLAQSVVDQLYAGGGVQRVFDLYGPTETTTYSTFTLCQRGGKTTIGRPIANTQIYLLDRHLQPVPIGVAGELHIGGVGLARGYHNRPELTAEKFIPNPFSAEPGARLYKTGDRARYLPDGNIEYLGRLDHQVKIRGFRIELGEIEAQLNQHPAVRAAAVLAREDTPGDKRLVAYVVARNESVSAAELRTHLQLKLPHYMLPAAFVMLKTLPLTPTGKVDRKALPPPESCGCDPVQAYVAPRNPIEEVIAGIFQKVLKLDRVGIQENFFHLGGHSLIATQVISRVRHVFDVDLSFRSVFESPTVEGMTSSLLRFSTNRAGLEKRAEMFLKVANLSESEADAILAEGS